MSMKSSHFEFLLHKSQCILSMSDLEVPDTAEEDFKCQIPDILPDHQFAIYAPDGRRAIYVAKRWMNSASNTPKSLYLENMPYGAPLYLSAWQIWWLSREGRLKGVQGPKGIPYVEGMALSLSEEQRSTARRNLVYVQHFMKLCEENDGRRTRKLAARACAEMAEQRDEKPMSVSTLYAHVKTVEGDPAVDPIVALAPKLNPGNTQRRFSAEFIELLNSAISASWSDPKGTALTVEALLEETTAPGGPYAHLASEAKAVTRRTIERCRANTDYYTRTYLRQGPDAADKISSFRIRQTRPAHPLEIVDVDHFTLDVVVYDDLVPTAFGRPDGVVFRDRSTGCVIGFELSFEDPSFATFLRGLKHAVYPKDPHTLPDGVTWPWHGWPLRLGVDNALHLIENDIKNAAVEFGFQVIEYRPGRGWEKGALEHTFAVTNQRYIQRLPGSVMSSPEERDKFDKSKKLGVPQISLSELRFGLTDYFARVHNRSMSAGIGELITLSDVPAKLWEKGIESAPMRPPVDPDIFKRLGGITDWVTVQNDGIRIDYLHYVSAELLAITQHPEHKFGTRQHGATRYQAIRDPSDLGVLHLKDPYRNVVIEVPLIDIQRRYANGLSLYQHKKIIEFHLKEMGKIEKTDSLDKARKRLELQLVKMHASRNKHDTGKRLARFVAKNDLKMRRSEIVEMAADNQINDHIDYFNPAGGEPLTKKSSRLQARLIDDEVDQSEADLTAATESALPTDDRPKPDSSGDPETGDEIEFLKRRHEGWED